MHLTVLSGDASVSVEYHGSVVIQSGRTAFEQRSDQHDVVGGGYLTVEAGRRTGNGFGQVEQIGIFCLAEIRSVMEFLKNY